MPKSQSHAINVLNKVISTTMALVKSKNVIVMIPILESLANSNCHVHHSPLKSLILLVRTTSGHFKLHVSQLPDCFIFHHFFKRLSKRNPMGAKDSNQTVG